MELNTYTLTSYLYKFQKRLPPSEYSFWFVFLQLMTPYRRHGDMTMITFLYQYHTCAVMYVHGKCSDMRKILKQNIWPKRGRLPNASVRTACLRNDIRTRHLLTTDPTTKKIEVWRQSKLLFPWRFQSLCLLGRTHSFTTLKLIIFSRVCLIYSSQNPTQQVLDFMNSRVTNIRIGSHYAEHNGIE